jgi:hypothetical protein
MNQPKIYFKYLSYVLRHKWFVFLECCKLGIPWRGFVHDMSKFRPCEFIPYARHFMGRIQTGRDKTGYYKPTNTGDPAFDKAWIRHMHANSHHWQYWVMPDASGNAVYEIPVKLRKEMLADWRGAGRAQGTPGTLNWYTSNGQKMQLGPETRKWIEEQIGFVVDS